MCSRSRQLWPPHCASPLYGLKAVSCHWDWSFGSLTQSNWALKLDSLNSGVRAALKLALPLSAVTLKPQLPRLYNWKSYICLIRLADIIAEDVVSSRVMEQMTGSGSEFSLHHPFSNPQVTRQRCLGGRRSAAEQGKGGLDGMGWPVMALLTILRKVTL